METLNSSSQCSRENISPAKWGVIDTRGLEALIKAKIPMVLVDARTDEWFDHTLIVSAERLPLDASSDTLKKILPHKDQLVVVYCAGEGCPTSKSLATRLVEEGYTCLIDYHEGIREWISHQNPIQKTRSGEET